jgi:hypothetical protein
LCSFNLFDRRTHNWSVCLPATGFETEKKLADRDGKHLTILTLQMLLMFVSAGCASMCFWFCLGPFACREDEMIRDRVSLG